MADNWYGLGTDFVHRVLYGSRNPLEGRMGDMEIEWINEDCDSVQIRTAFRDSRFVGKCGRSRNWFWQVVERDGYRASGYAATLSEAKKEIERRAR